ncbi:RNA recognition motif containing protein [Nitzschia inconspicua]|uniref:RNA recognition motif containing protein n=1 Tax=Nitzschia inconspicua TaxID=303405 RepID=A0A9K3PK66_9STRA|nr:RNA recognition motif containing protein [Nitzschia inconspicua]KAG7338465.1 RNA recognition motif containing protein [Nitzschia inconspicua]KAG7350742.1 RNA recognition motif containing protein [Nitzschia inconspicua]
MSKKNDKNQTDQDDGTESSKNRKDRKKEEKKKRKKSKIPQSPEHSIQKEPVDDQKDTKERKEKRKRGEEEFDAKVETAHDGPQIDATSNELEKKVAKKQKREDRKKNEEELLKKVPKKDPETGIGFTKLQIRRMLKRVKRGLPPIPTAQEEHERLKNEAMLRREEEAELAGMVFEEHETFSKPQTNTDDNSEASSSEIKEDEESTAQNEEAHSGSGEMASNQQNDDDQTSTKLAKRAKPVPHDYVCQACMNKNKPLHWIYDCPDKVTVRGTNQKKKRERGIHDPDSRKVFVSGLPFDVKSKDVCALFEQSCGKVTSCKLLTFEDTKRCNGQAIVTLSSDQAATEALKLSGTTMGGGLSQAKAKGKKEEDSPAKRKDLKLKVTKVLNRRKTKNVK